MSDNNISDLFINATRDKVRFNTLHGQLMVEDLWDLSLIHLDQLAVSLDTAIQNAGRKTFIDVRPKGAEDLQAKFDIVKHVIDTKLAEKAAAKVAADRAGQMAFLKGLQEKKQIQALENMSEEEISAKLAELGV